MFCGKCGSEIKEGAQFCSKCGQPMRVTPQPAAVSAAGAVAVSRKNRKVGIIAMAAVGVLVVAVIVGAVFFFTPKESPEEVAEKYMTASMNMDFAEAEKYAAVSYNKILKDTFQQMESMMESQMESMDEEKKQQMKSVLKLLQEKGLNVFTKEMAKERYTDLYGADYQVSFLLLDSVEVTGEEKREAVQSVRDFFETRTSSEGPSLNIEEYIDLSKISETKKITFEMSLESESYSDSFTRDVFLVKLNGKWKVLDTELESNMSQIANLAGRGAAMALGLEE